MDLCEINLLREYILENKFRKKMNYKEFVSNNR